MFDREFLQKLEYLDVVARKLLAGRIRADRLSSRRGTSVEFEDYRQYAVGDDLRYLDWNIFGRLEEFFLKLYKEEDKRDIYIAYLDALGSSPAVAPTGRNPDIFVPDVHPGTFHCPAL